MGARLLAALVLAAILGGCGGNRTGDPGSTTAAPTTDADSTTTSGSAATTVPGGSTSSSAPVPTTAAVTTSSTATTLLPSTTTTTDSSPLRPDGSPRALPEPTGEPGALPASAVPWSEVDASWTLLRTEENLVLLAPDDTLYLVAGGATVHDWAPGGRRVLVEQDGGLLVVDLASGAVEGPIVFPAEGYGRARFTRPTGRDVVVATQRLDRSRLEVLRTDGISYALITDHEVPPELRMWYAVTWVYGLDGMSVTLADSEGIRRHTNRGELLWSLPSPGLGCRVLRWWTADTLLVACTDRGYAEQHPEMPPDFGWRVWSVPLDGSPARALSPSTDEGAYGGVLDGLRVGTKVIIAHAGCCYCGSTVLIDGILQDDPFLTCLQDLIGLRNGKALAVASDQQTGQYLVEIDAGGAVRVVTPDLAVLQAFSFADLGAP